ncbi:mannose-6-phosphate isomerase 2-like [Neltuma alba]|uniref:mannose-6-phosphate isomerase 2-like n=1 Tax=Neltuma alba TaxID=207710 RepID=UPI0010A45D61|nr:mannose-6-phosphate isomerase 2-like [Prosopis alba]
METEDKLLMLRCSVKNYDWGRLAGDSQVLSVAKALSIQAHPDKDSVWVISLEELKVVIRTVPEVMELVGFGDALPIFGLTDQDNEETIKRELAAVFTRLMFADKKEVTESVGRLISRLIKESQVRELTDKEKLALRLEKQYPSDIGVIAAFLLNYMKLNPGEALSLGPNEPHAYISGECIECMATSDNVVRAGLTPKHRDVQTLCSMLTYKQGPPEILRGIPINSHVTRYLPPFDEFEIDRCVVPQGESVTFPAVPGPSIFLVVDGEAIIKVGGSLRVYIAAEGDVIFAAANTVVCISEASDLILYRAGVNGEFFEASEA